MFRNLIEEYEKSSLQINISKTKYLGGDAKNFYLISSNLI